MHLLKTVVDVIEQNLTVYSVVVTVVFVVVVVVVAVLEDDDFFELVNIFLFGSGGGDNFENVVWNLEEPIAVDDVFFFYRFLCFMLFLSSLLSLDIFVLVVRFGEQKLRRELFKTHKQVHSSQD